MALKFLCLNIIITSCKGKCSVYIYSLLLCITSTSRASKSFATTVLGVHGKDLSWKFTLVLFKTSSWILSRVTPVDSVVLFVVSGCNNKGMRNRIMHVSQNVTCTRYNYIFAILMFHKDVLCSNFTATTPKQQFVVFSSHSSSIPAPEKNITVKEWLFWLTVIISLNVVIECDPCDHIQWCIHVFSSFSCVAFQLLPGDLHAESSGEMIQSVTGGTILIETLRSSHRTVKSGPITRGPLKMFQDRINLIYNF